MAWERGFSTEEFFLAFETAWDKDRSWGAPPREDRERYCQRREEAGDEGGTEDPDRAAGDFRIQPLR